MSQLTLAKTLISQAVSGRLCHAPDISNAKKQIDYECEVNSSHILDRIYAARLHLLKHQPFYSTIALNISYKEDASMPTAAVDGRHMFYNKHFINALDDSELVFLICHEIMHLVLRHLTRCGRRNHTLYNKAADYVINYILVRDGIGKFPSIGGLYDTRFADMYTEEVYAILEEEQKNSGGGSGGSNFDEHIIIQQSGSGNQNSGSGDSGEDDQNSGGSRTVTMTEEEITELEADILSTVLEGMKAQRTSGAGKVPGEMERLIDELTTPRVNWRDILPDMANGQVKSNYSRRKPNRRFSTAQYGVCIPTLIAEDHVEFTLVIDTSGSISVDMLRDFVSEVYGVVEVYSSFTIHIWCFDTKVYNHQVFTHENAEEILSYEIKGGGGTDFMANWVYMHEIDHTPRNLIMLTDGLPWDAWGEEDYCETTFIIHDKNVINRRVQAPFGQTVYFDDFG